MAKDVWEEHQTIYHYTRLTGLIGILETQALHATNYAFLNDSQEARLLHSKLAKYVEPKMRRALSRVANAQPHAKERIASNGGLDSVARTEAQTICNALFRATFEMRNDPNFFEPFVVSFCGHVGSYEADHGLLSQWRGYGGDVGYAIAFDTKKFVDFLKSESERCAYHRAQLSTVVYDDDEETFREEFAELLNTLEDVFPDTFYETDDGFGALYLPFTENVVRLKHRGFKEENEVRAVLCPTLPYWFQKIREDQPEDFEKMKSKKVKVVHFRPSMAPYIVIGDAKESRLPISSIIVGPGPNRASRERELKKYLELKGLDIKVKVSETPLK